MVRLPGHYMYVSPGRQDVCGLFIIGSMNHIVALEFTGFNIDCDDEGLLVVGVQCCTCDLSFANNIIT